MKFAKRLFDSLIYMPSFKATLLPMSILARRRVLGMLDRASKFNAKVVMTMRGAKKRTDINDIGREWARMFPDDMQQKIGQDEQAVYYETHIKCPLRGTGDTQACYLTMEFDRAMLRKIGGEFVVLASQAEPGRETCIVAMTKSAEYRKTLIDAHIRTETGEAFSNKIPAVNIH